MKYEKPEVRLLGSALAEVRNLNDKSEMDRIDDPIFLTTSSATAYAADE